MKAALISAIAFGTQFSRAEDSEIYAVCEFHPSSERSEKQPLIEGFILLKDNFDNADIKEHL